MKTFNRNIAVKRILPVMIILFSYFFAGIAGAAEDTAVRAKTESPFRYGFVEAMGGYMLPAGKFSKLFRDGYGGSLCGGVNLVGAMLMVEAGGYRLKGKDENTDSGIMVPGYFSFGYAFSPFRDFTVSPILSSGFMHVRLKYDPDGFIAGEQPQYVTESKTEPSMKAGIFLGYFIGDVRIEVGAEYGVILESYDVLQFFLFRAGAGYRL